MAKALIKADVRGRASFFNALRSQQEKRRGFGELSFSLNCDDHKEISVTSSWNGSLLAH